MENDDNAYMECLLNADNDDVLIVFTQRLATLFYPLTSVRDLHFTTQRLFEFHDAVLDLARVRTRVSPTVEPFIRATNRLVNQDESDDLTSLVYQTLINRIAQAMLERKP